MASKSLSKALRHGTREARPLIQCTANQQRAFSSTPRSQKHGAVPVLSNAASTPELTALLATIRRTIFVPALITKQHRKLIFSPKSAQSLENEPFTVELAGEDFRLQHIDRTKDQPNGWKGVMRAMGLFQTKADWDNLPKLFEGFKEAKRNILNEEWKFGKIVRTAAKSGRMDVVIECLRRSEITGFNLQTPDNVALLMFWNLYEAGERGFDATVTKKALNLAEEVVRALESDSALKQDIGRDTISNAVTVGALLGLSAKKAALEGKDIGDKARTYADRYLQITKSDPTLNHILETNEDLSIPLLSSLVFALKAAAAVFPQDQQLGERASRMSEKLEAAKEAEGAQTKPLNEWCYNNLGGNET